jgi:hypothetical protein
MNRLNLAHGEPSRNENEPPERRRVTGKRMYTISPQSFKYMSKASALLYSCSACRLAKVCLVSKNHVGVGNVVLTSLLQVKCLNDASGPDQACPRCFHLNIECLYEPRKRSRLTACNELVSVGECLLDQRSLTLVLCCSDHRFFRSYQHPNRSIPTWSSVHHLLLSFRSILPKTSKFTKAHNG